MHLEKLVHILNLHTAALGNADLALGVQQIGPAALLGGHRTDDRIHAQQHAVIHTALGHRLLGLLHARQHAREHAEAAHFLHLAQLPAQVVHIELTLGHPRCQLLGVFRIDRRRRLLDQRDDVAHAQNAVGHARGVERLDRVELFAGAGKLDRLAGDRAHRQRRATARIAIHPGQHDASEIDLARERLRDVDRILPGQRIDDEQGFTRLGDRRHRLHLVHQRAIDVEAAGGIEQQHIDRLQAGGIQRALGDGRRGLAGDDRQRRDIDLCAQHRQLLLRGRAVDVERRHQHLLAVLLADQLAELGSGRGLARALKPNHHDHHRRRGVEVQPLGRRPAQRFHQRVVDDLDDLLPRRDRAQHIGADRLFGHPVDKPAHHRQRHVGLEQRDANLAHRLAHVLLAQGATAPQLVEHATETIGQVVEHLPAPHGALRPRPTAPRKEPKRKTRKKPADETSSASFALIGSKCSRCERPDQMRDVKLYRNGGA